MKKKKAGKQSPLKKEKSSFLLRLNKELYRKDVIQKALSDDKDWVKETSAPGDYFYIRLKTPKIKDVFDWMNYLIYLHKA